MDEKVLTKSLKLSRYACYLIIQNADSAKKLVALGQTYFAIQARLQEIKQSQEYNRLNKEDEKRIFLRNQLAQHNISLASVVKKAGVVDPADYAIFQNHGYQGLYGGLDARSIRRQKNLRKSQHILDHMGSTELAANLFRTTQAEEKLKRENIQGKESANEAHYEVGKKVRKTIEDLGGEMPENLPTVESVKSLKKQLDQKKLQPEKK